MVVKSYRIFLNTLLFNTFKHNLKIYWQQNVLRFLTTMYIYLSNVKQFHYFQHDITTCCIYRIVPPDDEQ